MSEVSHQRNLHFGLSPSPRHGAFSIAHGGGRQVTRGGPSTMGVGQALKTNFRKNVTFYEMDLVISELGRSFETT